MYKHSALQQWLDGCTSWRVTEKCPDVPGILITLKMEKMNEALVQQEVYLIERRVRPMAQVHTFNGSEFDAMKLWTRLQEITAGRDVIPFMHKDKHGTYSLCIASAGWVVRLYRWAWSADIPQEQMMSIEGLLYGYGVEAIMRNNDSVGGYSCDVASLDFDGVNR